jgi:FkbM family methyltransferase
MPEGYYCFLMARKTTTTLSDFVLFAKSRIVRTPLEGFAKYIRYTLGAVQRYKTPELWRVHQEDRLLNDILKKLLREDSCCVDVGCHIGSFLSRIYKLSPNGQHVAFEPVERKISWLKRTFPEATIIHAAVSDKTGTAGFVEDKKYPGYSHLASDGNGYEISILTLDDAIHNVARVDFIKIDTEGHELQVLKGAIETVLKFRPIIVFECGSEYNASLDRKGLYEMIVERMGYRIYTFADFISANPPLSFEQFRQCGLYPFRAFNFLATPYTK